MQLKQLGKSSLQVSKLGLGLAALGRPGYINLGHSTDLEKNYDQEAMQARAFRVLDLAWEKGIRYFDTARSYGLGELFLGNWLKQRDINPLGVVIGSKWGYTYTADWKIQAEHHEVKEHSLPVLNRQWEETKETLGNHLDLYQIHSATLQSGVLTNSAVLNRLAEIKEKGIKVGLSLSGTQQTDTLLKALEIEVDGNLLFDSVQATYNILETAVESALIEAHQLGLGIIIKEALANGRLTSRNTETSFAQQREILQTEANKYQVGIDAISIAYVLNKPWVDVVLSGAAQETHLMENLKGIEIQLDKKSISNLNELKEESLEYWAHRKKLEWN